MASFTMSLKQAVTFLGHLLWFLVQQFSLHVLSSVILKVCQEPSTDRLLVSSDFSFSAMVFWTFSETDVSCNFLNLISLHILTFFFVSTFSSSANHVPNSQWSVSNMTFGITLTSFILFLIDMLVNMKFICKIVFMLFHLYHVYIWMEWCWKKMFLVKILCSAQRHNNWCPL